MSSVWLMHLDVSDVFHDPALSIAEKSQVIAGRIQSHRWTDSNGYVYDLAEELAEQTDADAFDAIWDAIYDEADRDRVWVVTR